MTTTKLTDQRKAELTQICVNMQLVSDRFYQGAVLTGNHAFIEFCGLMNEYIKVCRDNIANDVDFTQANIHSGNGLIMRDYQINYALEKFECIYGASIQNLKRRRVMS